MKCADIDVPKLLEHAPAMGGRFLRWLGCKLLCLMGWKIRGQMPNIKQLVVVAAPHTSNWDFVIAMIARLALDLRFSFLMKQEAFFWPFKSLFMFWGGIPIDRSQSGGIVDQITAWYANNEKVWLVITPEGSRGKVDRWKTGFLRIAQSVNVPVLLVHWDYPTKTIWINKIATLSGDHERDAADLQKYVNKNFRGRYPSQQ